MVLRAIEQKIEALFEGVFGRAFRTNVQPVELARKLAKEMDDHKTVSVSRVYVPNEYTVYLSPSDREQFEGYETSLVAELEEYLGEHNMPVPVADKELAFVTRQMSRPRRTKTVVRFSGDGSDD